MKRENLPAPQPETFKQLVKRISKVKTQRDHCIAYCIIEYSAQNPGNRPKITHEDETILLNLLYRVRLEDEDE